MISVKIDGKWLRKDHTSYSRLEDKLTSNKRLAARFEDREQVPLNKWNEFEYYDGPWAVSKSAVHGDIIVLP